MGRDFFYLKKCKYPFSYKNKPMKRVLLLVLFSFFMLEVFPQWGQGFVNFDDTIGLYRIYIDTTIQGNAWQIGAPHKTVFNGAYSFPNAIMTDTLNPCPPGSQSVFYYRTSGDFNTDSHDAGLGFWYKTDCDTLSDYGIVEMSVDSGQTWHNILTWGYGYASWVVYDSLYNVVETSWSGNDTIIFTGKNTSWYLFSCDDGLDMSIYDSIIYRFTFHSSDSSSLRDGWMIDNIHFNTWWESVPGHGFPCRVYPNPARDRITILSPEMIEEYEITGIMGTVLAKGKTNGKALTIDLSGLPEGLYFYRIRLAGGDESSGKFIRMR
jgi:hypothetical protein